MNNRAEPCDKYLVLEETQATVITIQPVSHKQYELTTQPLPPHTPEGTIEVHGARAKDSAESLFLTTALLISSQSVRVICQARDHPRWECLWLRCIPFLHSTSCSIL